MLGHEMIRTTQYTDVKTSQQTVQTLPLMCERSTAGKQETRVPFSVSPTRLQELLHRLRADSEPITR
jgi:hypothetical protein